MIVFISCNNENLKLNAITSESFELKREISSYIEKRYPAKLVNDSIIKLTDNTGGIEIHKFFNSDNELEKTIYYDSYGKLYSIRKVLTNVFNKYVGTETFDSSNVLLSKEKVVQSTDNFLVINSINYKENTTTTSEMTYDSNKLNTSIKSVLNDSSFVYWEYFRDNDGFLIKTETTFKYGSTINNSTKENKYLQFDNQGNWIKRMDYVKNDDEIYIYERTITYRTK